MPSNKGKQDGYKILLNSKCSSKMLGYGTMIFGLTYLLSLCLLGDKSFSYDKNQSNSHHTRHINFFEHLSPLNTDIAIRDDSRRLLHKEIKFSNNEEHNMSDNKIIEVDKEGMKKLDFVDRNTEFSTTSNIVTVVHLTHGNSTNSNKRAYHETYKKRNKNAVPTSVLNKVWAFWFGPPMKGARRFAFAELQDNIGVEVEVVTDETLEDYNIEEWPMHPAVFTGSLSSNHKADYLRAYFMYHYGGGYHDVKPHLKKDSWKLYFQNFTSDSNLWLYGIKEANILNMGCDEAYLIDALAITDEDFDSEKVLSYMDVSLNTDNFCGRSYEKNREAIVSGQRGKLSLDKFEPIKEGLCCSEIFKNFGNYPFVSNGAYIMRDHTDFAYDWLRIVEARLDIKYDRIRDHPAPQERCCNPAQPPYPLRWAEVHGEAFHPLQIKYQKHIKQGLPKWARGKYRGPNEENRRKVRKY